MKKKKRKAKRPQNRFDPMHWEEPKANAFANPGPGRVEHKFDPPLSRVPVNFNYTGLNWDFIKLMAEIPPYADEKYTTWTLYTRERMEGEKSPINHLIEHSRQYMAGEPYDKFDNDVGRHLVAIAYNAMMEWYYLRKFGHKAHPLVLDHREPIKPFKLDDMMKTVVTGAAITSVANLMAESMRRGRRRRKKKR